MKKVVRLTESDLAKIVKRVIKEQSQEDVFLNKGYKIAEPKGQRKDLIDRYSLTLKNKFGFGETKAYEKNNILLISDGTQVYFLAAPQGVTVTKVYNIQDIQNKL